MDTLIEYLVNEIKNKGIKGIIPLISIIILALIFISPSYTFIFFYKRSLFLDYNLSINIMIVLILDMLLFLVLFVIGSLRDIEVNDKFKFIDNGKKFKDVIMTIVLMGVVSIVITLVYSGFLINGWNTNVTLGVKTLFITLAVTFLNYICKIVMKSLLVVWNKRKEKKDNLLCRLLVIIFSSWILAIVIIIKILNFIWSIIFNGKK